MNKVQIPWNLYKYFLYFFFKCYTNLLEFFLSEKKFVKVSWQLPVKNFDPIVESLLKIAL